MTDATGPGYRHTQTGWLMRVAGIVVPAVVAGPPALRAFAHGDSDAAYIYFAVLAITAVWCVSFSSMTIVVDRNCVRWSYGFGWPGGMIDRAIIGWAEDVDVSALFGMGGLRRTVSGGWLWSVAPGSAVSFWSDGCETMLGTDDPEGLLAALRDAPNGAPQGDTRG